MNFAIFIAGRLLRHHSEPNCSHCSRCSPWTGRLLLNDRLWCGAGTWETARLCMILAPRCHCKVAVTANWYQFWPIWSPWLLPRLLDQGAVGWWHTHRPCGHEPTTRAAMAAASSLARCGCRGDCIYCNNLMFVHMAFIFNFLFPKFWFVNL